MGNMPVLDTLDLEIIVAIAAIFENEGEILQDKECLVVQDFQ